MSLDLREEEEEVAKESGRQRRELIVELDTGPPSQCTASLEGSNNSSVETGGEWAVTYQDGRECQPNAGREQVEIEDIEEEMGVEVDRERGTGGQRYLFEKLSDIPAVRDPAEVEAADRALERLANCPPHQLSHSDRVWELAARGGSTQAGEAVPLDRESRERVKERLRTHKLTDKTTLAF